MGDMTEWFLEINEQIMDEITIQFAEEQAEGFYVIEQFMNWDDVMSMLEMIMTPEFFETMFAFMPEVDAADLEIAMADLDEAMAVIASLFEEAEINLDLVFRSYINQETLEFETYGIDMELDFALNLDLGILGSFDISGEFVMEMVIDYNPTIVWPVIDEVLSLDDIMGSLGGVETFELAFGEDALEERVALTLEGMNIAVVELDVADAANFNVFIANNGDAAITIMIEDADVIVEILPGQVFVTQLAAGAIENADLVIISAAALNVEAGFRLTASPLN